MKEEKIVITIKYKSTFQRQFVKGALVATLMTLKGFWESKSKFNKIFWASKE